MGPHRLLNASIAGIWPIASLKVVYSGSRGPFWTDFAIFEILAGVCDTGFLSIPLSEIDIAEIQFCSYGI